MKRIYPILLLLVLTALVGKTTVTAFAPELNYSAVLASDWSEESEEEDESGEDDKVFESVGGLLAVILPSETLSIPLSQRLETLPREIPVRPPQA